MHRLSRVRNRNKGSFPDLHSQSVQQIIADFCEAIASAESLRKKGEPFAYPYRKPRYRQVIFTADEPSPDES